MRRAPISLLAIASLVLAVFGCCPPLSLVGSVLGSVALRRIVMSNGAVRGRRLARAAMIIGLCFGLAGAISWWRFFNAVEQWTNETSASAVEAFVHAAQQNDVGVARAALSPSRHAPSDAAINAFGEVSFARYGSFRSFRLVAATPAGSGWTTMIDVAGTFSFDQRDVPGSARFALQQVSVFSMPRMSLQRIVIDDAQHGDLTLTADTTDVIPPPATQAGERPAANP